MAIDNTPATRRQQGWLALMIVAILVVTIAVLESRSDALPSGTPPNDAAVLAPTVGDSGTTFNFTFPGTTFIACPGDATNNYRWGSFVTPFDQDPATLTFDGSGFPIAAGATAPLVSTAGIAVSNRLPSIGTGAIGISDVDFDFAAGPYNGFFTSGDYWVGIVCTQPTGSVVENVRYWAVPITITLQPGAGPSGFTWGPQGHDDTTTTSSSTPTSSSTTSTTTSSSTTSTSTSTTMPPPDSTTTSTTMPPPDSTTTSTSTTMPPPDSTTTSTTTSTTSTTTAPPPPPGETSSGVRGSFTVVEPSGPCITVENGGVSFGQLLAGSDDAVPGDRTTSVTSCTNQDQQVAVSVSDAIAEAPAAATLMARTCPIAPTSPTSMQCNSAIGSNQFGYASTTAAGGPPQSVFTQEGAGSVFSDLDAETSRSFDHFVQAPGVGAPEEQFDFVVTYTAVAR